MSYILIIVIIAALASFPAGEFILAAAMGGLISVLIGAVVGADLNSAFWFGFVLSLTLGLFSIAPSNKSLEENHHQGDKS